MRVSQSSVRIASQVQLNTRLVEGSLTAILAFKTSNDPPTAHHLRLESRRCEVSGWNLGLHHSDLPKQFLFGLDQIEPGGEGR